MSHNFLRKSTKNRKDIITSSRSVRSASVIFNVFRECSGLFGRELFSASAFEIILVLQLYPEGIAFNGLCKELEDFGSTSTIRRWVEILEQRKIIVAFNRDGSTMHSLSPSAQLSLGIALQSADQGELSA